MAKNKRKQMRIIFLDFDGVLNSETYLFERIKSDETFTTASLTRPSMIDDRAVERLNGIIEASGPNTAVVLSTAWRLHHSVDALRGILRERGFVGTIIGRTIELSYGYRGDEVKDWLLKNSAIIESFVVLDDLDQFHDMRSRHVHTNLDSGLTDAHAAKAIRILNTKLSDENAVRCLRKAS